jgi:hypothetical protein
MNHLLEALNPGEINNVNSWWQLFSGFFFSADGLVDGRNIAA